MKKLLISVAILTGLSMALAGCSNSKKTTNTTQESSEILNIQSEIGETKKTENLEITVEAAKIVDNPLNTDLGKTTLEVKVKSKNISEEEQDIGTPDFKILDAKGNEYKFTSSEDNFGDVIEPGKTLEGAGYYSIPNDMTSGVIVYNPFQTALQLKWEAEFEGARKTAKQDSKEKMSKEAKHEENKSSQASTENTKK